MFVLKDVSPLACGLASSKMAKAETAKEEAPILSDPAGYLRRSINATSGTFGYYRELE